MAAPNLAVFGCNNTSQYFLGYWGQLAGVNHLFINNNEKGGKFKVSDHEYQLTRVSGNGIVTYLTHHYSLKSENGAEYEGSEAEVFARSRFLVKWYGRLWLVHEGQAGESSVVVWHSCVSNGSQQMYYFPVYTFGCYQRGRNNCLKCLVI